MSDGNYLERVLTEFVDAAENKDFIIVIDPEDPAQFVQFLRRRGTIYAEVSSRRWGPPSSDRPLSDSNELSLMRLGFTHGGRAKNYAMDGVTADGLFMADLARRGFKTAYGQTLTEVPKIASTVSSVESLVSLMDGPADAVNPSGHGPRAWPCPICDRRDPFIGRRYLTGPALLNRARRAATGNFVRVQLDCEEHVVMVDAVSRTRSFDGLPEQVQDWILKAEDGPLFV
jgi:hypothetical protein